MTDEDSETSASEAQAQDESELPVIQLCGLVEELRYQPAGFWGRSLLSVWARSLVQHGMLQVRLEH